MPRVMIVEDQEIIRSNLAQILSLSGVDVVEAEDGGVALDKLLLLQNKGQGLPQLIISDLSMPRMDGFALLERVRQEPAYLNTPFVFLSAHSDVSDINRAFELGATDYLIKPFEIEELIAMVSLHLEKNQPKPESSVVPAAASKIESHVSDPGFFLE